MDARRCGRTTGRGTVCRQYMARAEPLASFFTDYVAPACPKHMTAAEKVALQEHKVELAKLIRAAEPTKPECWSWSVTEEDLRLAAEEQWIARWQDRRCGVCGDQSSDSVLDHDHETGWIRGFLCKSCNGLEAGATSLLFRRYRKWNPARILGVWRRYCHPFYGMDRGQLHGRQTYLPLSVDRNGFVLYQSL